MKLSVALLAALVTGCAAAPLSPPSTLPLAAAEKIAVDSVALLKTHYPPAQTQLRLTPHADDFSPILTQQLRHHGYGLQETPSLPALSTQPPYHELTYTLHTAGLDTVITLSVAGVSFHRLYQRQGQQLCAVSCWSRGPL